MIKAFLPYLYTSVVVGAVAGGSYLLSDPDEPIQPTALLQQDELKPQVQAPAPTQTEPEELEVEAVSPLLPSFTTLRVEPDGSTVIAGAGPQNSRVEILNGTDVIAETQSTPNGDFVVVLDNPLKPGAYSLFIQAYPENSEPVLSNEAGLINIPEPETQEEVTVLVSAADKPTQVLQKPETPEEELTLVSNTASETVEVKKPVKDEAAKIEQASISTQQAEQVATNPTVAPSSAKPVLPVLIEAADVEKNRIFIAGKGEAGYEVKIYMNSDLLGSAKITSNNAFLYEGSSSLAAGRYDLRADMVDPASGKVVARAEVSLLHSPEDRVPEPVAVANTEAETKPEADQENTVSQTEPASEVALADNQQSEISDESGNIKPEIKTGSSVIIRRGDNLWRVATRNYGFGIRYTTIFEANKDQIRNPNLIYPGQVLKVPQKAETETDEDAG